MDLHSYRERARQAIVQARYPVIRVVCLYSLSILATSLIINCISFYIDNIETSGLSNAIALNGMSSIFYCLSMILSLFSGVWLICFRSYCVRLNQNPQVDYKDLLSALRNGVRYFSVNFRIALKQLLWVILLMFLSCYVIVYYYSFSTGIFSAESVAGLSDYDAIVAYLSEAMTEEVLSSIFTAINISAIFAYILAFILTYKFRLASYFSIWTSYPAAICLRLSKQLLRGHKKELFSLELSFAHYWILYLVPSAALVLFDTVYSLSDNLYFFIFCLIALGTSVIEILWLPELECSYAFYATELFERACAEATPKEPQPLLPNS